MMSMTHRFGVGVGGSYEDPYQPQFCDECTRPHGSCEECVGWAEYVQKMEESMPVQEPPEEIE